MQVILRENVENLGRIGDIVKVSDGYARNFLIPRGMVTIADEKNKAAIEHHKRSLERKRLALRSSSEELAKKLADFQVTISRKVGENDRLFGSVSTTDISEGLKAGGFQVERRWIHIEHPIKALGVHPVTVKLDTEVTATVKVWVVKEEA
jgi:large subunit ribosomal protein L9